MSASAAVTAYDDPRARARHLRNLHASWAVTGEVPSGLRDVVRRAWSRPAVQRSSQRPVLSDDDLQVRRERHQLLLSLVPLLHERLQPLTDDSTCELVVCDPEGVVLDIAGPGFVRRASDRLGFVCGAQWSEGSAGANALGTALVDREPVQLLGPEHSNERHHGWVCTAAPLLSPDKGTPLGAFTLSGPLRCAHPHTLTLVRAVAAEAQHHLAVRHNADLQRVRARAPQVTGPHVVVDANGSVALASGLVVPGQLRLPRGLRDGATSWVTGVGLVEATWFGDGWVLRPSNDHVVGMVIDLCAPLVEVHGSHGLTRVQLTDRQHELLVLLANHPAGLQARELSALVYGRSDATVTVRAELSRLRSRLGGIVASRPYRLTVPATLRNPAP